MGFGCYFKCCFFIAQNKRSPKLKRNVTNLNPHSNVTGPNNSYVLTHHVFGNLYEERHAEVIRGCSTDRSLTLFEKQNKKKTVKTMYE